MWIWIAASLAAYFVKGLCGFANTLVFTSILGFGADNVNISPVELLLSYPTNIILTIKNRGRLNPRVFIPLSLLVLCGSIPGAFLLKNMDAHYLKIVFGFVVVISGIDMYLRERNALHAKESRFLPGIIGLLSGVLCGMFGVGALLAAYVGRVTSNSDEFKANINAVFTVENTFRIILYAATGILSKESIRLALILAPFMITGLLAGMKICKRIDERKIRLLIIFLLIVSGAVQIVNNIA